jgi:hypothetical protein
MDFFKKRAIESVQFKKIPADRIFAYLMKRLSCMLQMGMLNNLLVSTDCFGHSFNAPPQAFVLAGTVEE